MVTGLSIGSSVLSALLPDLTPTSQHGMGSGFMSVLGIVGSLLGFVLKLENMLTNYRLSYDGPVMVQSQLYLGYMPACLLGSTVVSCFFAKEKPWNATLKSTSLLNVVQ